MSRFSIKRPVLALGFFGLTRNEILRATPSVGQESGDNTG